MFPLLQIKQFPILSFYFVMYLPDSMVIWFYGWRPFICLAWGPQTMRKRKYYVLNSLCEFTRLSPRCQTNLWLYRWIPLINHQLSCLVVIDLEEEEILKECIFWRNAKKKSQDFLKQIEKTNFSISNGPYFWFF